MGGEAGHERHQECGKRERDKAQIGSQEAVRLRCNGLRMEWDIDSEIKVDIATFTIPLALTRNLGLRAGLLHIAMPGA